MKISIKFNLHNIKDVKSANPCREVTTWEYITDATEEEILALGDTDNFFYTWDYFDSKNKAKLLLSYRAKIGGSYWFHPVVTEDSKLIKRIKVCGFKQVKRK